MSVRTIEGPTPETQFARPNIPLLDTRTGGLLSI
jgi:hypothetical protein